MASSFLLPAPGRGQYDRRQPREERLSEQRSRLMAAAALAAARGGAGTVAAVVKLAGTSRNTFYEYFDDVEHAREAAALRAQQQLEQALRQAEEQARTPVERWRATARAWFEWAATEPAEARLCLAPRGEGLSVAGGELERALGRSLAASRAEGVLAAEHDALRLIATAAAAEAFARRILAIALNDHEERELERERARCEKSLVDVAVRLLR